jgi:hypothetical protein
MAAIPLTLAAIQGLSFAGGIHMLCSLLPADRKTFGNLLVQLSGRFWGSLQALFSALAAVGEAILKVLQSVTNGLFRGLRTIGMGLVRLGKAFLLVLEAWCHRWSEDPWNKEQQEVQRQLERLGKQKEVAEKKAEVTAIDSDRKVREAEAEAIGTFLRKLGGEATGALRKMMEKEMGESLEDMTKIDMAFVQILGDKIREGQWEPTRKTIHEWMEVRQLCRQALTNTPKVLSTFLEELEQYLSVGATGGHTT